MIKHVLMWKMKDRAAGRGKDENIALCTEALYALKDRIDVVRRVEVGRNFAAVENAYDLAVIVELDGRADFAAFLEHPAHAELGELVRPLRVSSIVVDYET